MPHSFQTLQQACRMGNALHVSWTVPTAEHWWTQRWNLPVRSNVRDWLWREPVAVCNAAGIAIG